MFLTGCSPVRPMPPQSSEKKKTDYEIAIPSDSLVVGLWGDIKEKWIKDHKGDKESLAELLEKVDRGYDVFLYGSVPQHLNRSGAIEQQEVLDFAYGNEEYYSLLVKRGFPVPYAMDDFNDDTGDDKTWKKKITDGVNLIKVEYEKSKGSAQPGTREYKRELCIRIRSFLGSYFKEGTKKCDHALNDWEALEKKCGVCVEQSYISYFALRKAGLDPQFMELHRFKPTLGAMGLFFDTSALTPGHVFVSVPLSQGENFNFDLAVIPDIPQEFYAEAKRISPRIAASYYLNNWFLVDDKFPMPLEKYQMWEQLMPEDANAWKASIHKQNTLRQISDNELEQLIEKAKPRFAGSPVFQYDVNIIKHRRRFGLNRPEMEQPIFKQLREDSPYAADSFSVAHGSGFLTGKDQNAARMHFIRDNLFETVKHDPTFVGGLKLYDFISRLWTAGDSRSDTCRSLVENYRSLRDLHPEHNFIRFLSANANLDCYSFEYGLANESDKAEYEKIRKEGIAQLKEVIKREPGAPQAHARYGSVLLSLGDREHAAEELNETVSLIEKRNNALLLSAEAYGNLIQNLYSLGDRDNAKRLTEIIRKNSESGAWMGIVESALSYDPIALNTQGYRFLSSGAELERSLTVLEDTLDKLAECGFDRKRIEALRIRHAVAFLVLGNGREDLAERLLKHVDFNDEEKCGTLVQSIEKVLLNFVNTSNLMTDAIKFNTAKTAVGFMERKVPAPMQRQLALSFLFAGITAYNTSNKDDGGRFVRRAFELDKDKAETLYFNSAYMGLKNLRGNSANLQIQGKGGKSSFASLCEDPRRLNSLELRFCARTWERASIGYEAAHDAAAKAEALKKSAALDRLAAVRQK